MDGEGHAEVVERLLGRRVAAGARDLHARDEGVFSVLAEIGMWPEGFEQLDFDDQVILVRFHLRCAALMLLVVVLVVLNCGWEGQVLGVLASAGLAALADQAERVLRRLDDMIGIAESRPGADRRPPPRHDRRIEKP